MTTVVHTIQGWQPPHWATKVIPAQHTQLLWRRPAAGVVRRVSGPDDEPEDFQPSLERFDRIDVDYFAGTITAHVGETFVRVADDLEIRLDELPALLEAMGEFTIFAEHLASGNRRPR